MRSGAASRPRVASLVANLARRLRRLAADGEAREERAREQLAVAWEAIAGTQGKLEVRLIGGGRLRLYGDSVLGGYICKHRFEADELVFLHRYLRPGDVFVDIGANIGLFSIVAGRIVGPGGRVFAFEPGKCARERLQENVGINRLRNVVALPWALSDRREHLQLTVPGGGHDAFASLAAPIVPLEGVSEGVETRAWDDLKATLPRADHARMMKVDVEGWESRALSGAAGHLRRLDAPLLQVEFAEETARSAGSSCVELFRQIEALGYVLCRFERGANRLVPERAGREYSYSNLYATKRIEDDNRMLRSGPTLRWLRAPRSERSVVWLT